MPILLVYRNCTILLWTIPDGNVDKIMKGPPSNEGRGSPEGQHDDQSRVTKTRFF